MKTKLSCKKKVLIVLAVVLTVYCVGSTVGVNVIYASMFGRDAGSDGWFCLRCTDQPAGDILCEKVMFPSGDNMLAGWVYGKLLSNKAVIIMAHGSESSADEYLAQALWFAEKDYHVLLYDCTGTGLSRGEDAVGPSQSLLDLDAAVRFIEERGHSMPIFIFGHGWGGYAAAEILAYDHDIAGSVSISGYDTPLEMMCETVSDDCGPLAYACYPFLWLYQRQLFGSAANQSAAEALSVSSVPVMVVHGTADESIAYDGASLIAHRDEVKNPKVEWLTLEGEDHMSLLYPSDEAYTNYIDMKRVEYEALSAQYGGNIPADVSDEFYGGIDRSIACRVNEPLMERILAFYEAQLH